MTCIVGILRNFVKQGQGINAFLLIMLLGIGSCVFMLVMAEKIQLLTSSGLISPKFRAPYYILTLFLFLAFFSITGPMTALVRFGGFRDPILFIAMKWNGFLQTVWWLYVLFVDNIINNLLIQEMYRVASMEHSKKRFKNLLQDLKDCLKTLPKASDGENLKIQLKQKRKLQYLIALRFTIICIMSDIFFLVLFLVSTFLKFPDKAESFAFQATTATMASAGLHLHMLGSSILLDMLSAL